MPRTVAKPPSECSPDELATFAALVREGGEVDAIGLEDRIASAHLLSFCYQGKVALGIAGIKKPADSYRAKVSLKSGQLLPAEEWPFELGWVFVTPWARKSGVGKTVLNAALAEVSEGVFATSRTDNVAMHAAFRRFDFAAAGKPYPSERPERSIQLFLRAKSLN
jgi:predicted GNAT family N-acyltransferase